MKIENLNAYASLLINDYPQKAFNIKESYNDKGNRDTVEALKEISFNKYGRPKAEVEEEIMRKFSL